MKRTRKNASAAKRGSTARQRVKRATKRSGGPRPVRQGSKRAKILEQVSRKGGATFQEIQRATGWTASYFRTRDKRMSQEAAEAAANKTTYEGIRLLRTFAGYPVEKVDNKYVLRAA